MAIKRPKKDDPKQSNLPPEFLDRSKKAFSLQAIAGKYKDAFDGEKVWIKNYLEETEEMTVELSKGIKTPDGTVIMAKRDNWVIDINEVEKMIKTGQLSLTTILAISTINATKLKDSIGEPNFKKIAENKPTEYLSMTANAEFKRSIEETFSLSEIISNEPESIKSEPKAPEKKAPSVKDSLAKAKAAEKRIASKSASPDADLDAILGE